MDIEKLVPHPENHRIYSAQDLSDLELSLQSHGQLEPVAITKDNQIISGHRRVAAMKNLGWTDVDVRIIDPDNVLIALIEHNRHRVKTTSDILNEARVLSEQLKTYVGRGRNATTKRAGKRVKMIEEVAKRLDMGTTSLKQLQSISNYEPALVSQIDNKEISVSAAYQYVREKHLLPKRKIHAGVSHKDTTKDLFRQEFAKLLSQHNPSVSQVNEVLSQTYPYSLELTGVSPEQRVDLIEHLEGRRSMTSEQLMFAQKMDELDHNAFSEKQQSAARKFLPTQEELHEWWMKGITSNVEGHDYNLFDDVSVVAAGADEQLSSELWSIFRLHASSFEHSEGPGRHLRGFVVLKHKTGPKILGFFSFASDSHSLSGRDEHIGWNTTQRSVKREHIINLNTCIPTQPFGFNRLGGKFVSLAALDAVSVWEQKYKTKVVGVTTTSLHGPTSQYNGMSKFWKSLKTSSGSMLMAPDKSRYSFWREWFREHYPDAYEQVSARSSPKQAFLHSLYRYLGINAKDYEHGHKRGVYFCPLYENYREFLCEEIAIEELVPKPIVWHEWWRLKARKRYESVEKENRVQTDSFWLNQIGELDFQVWANNI